MSIKHNPLKLLADRPEFYGDRLVYFTGWIMEWWLSRYMLVFLCVTSAALGWDALSEGLYACLRAVILGYMNAVGVATLLRLFRR